MSKKLILFLLALPFQLVYAQPARPIAFTKEHSPAAVGKRLAYHLVDKRHDLYDRYIHYAEVCTWNGAVDYAVKTGDQKLIKLLQDKFEPLFSREKPLLPPMNHVDYNMFGSLALKLYQVNHDKRYRELGLAYADTQW